MIILLIDIYKCLTESPKSYHCHYHGPREFMQEKKVEDIYQHSARQFQKGTTRGYGARRAALDALAAMLRKNEQRILSALHADLAKHRFEAWTTEIGAVLLEIDFARRRLKRWMRPRKVSTPVFLKPGRSYIRPEPRGSALVIAPWNYPIQLALSPVVSAVAAGNTVVLKPSEITSNCSSLLAEMIGEELGSEIIQVVEGDAELSKSLVDRRWDYVFFTGSPRVGRLIYQAAAQHGTPCTLELGGKNPCVVGQEADLSVASRRIVWGKFLNAGQTCVAPDYLIVEQPSNDSHRSERVVEALMIEITRAYGAYPLENSDLASIVNDHHYERVLRFLEAGPSGDRPRVRTGGRSDQHARRIEPTIVDEIEPNHPALQEEIFGPILPIITVNSLQEARSVIEARDEGLAAYYFGSHRRAPEILNRVRFGGGCCNDTILHLANPHLPFGGSGPSGIGRYHGRYGFDTFSHHKSLLYAPRRFDLPLRYAPYGDRRLSLLKRILG